MFFSLIKQTKPIWNYLLSSFSVGHHALISHEDGSFGYVEFTHLPVGIPFQVLNDVPILRQSRSLLHVALYFEDS